MASNSDGQDNPVNINVVPMVDVIFCLCVFFMCSFAFKVREGRFEAWMPKDLGGVGALPAIDHEIDVALAYDTRTNRVTRQFGSRAVKDDLELEHLIDAARADYESVGQVHIPLNVESGPAVPWSSVVQVVDVAHRLGLKDIRFRPGMDARYGR